jgi:hypothetical protein
MEPSKERVRRAITATNTCRCSAVCLARFAEEEVREAVAYELERVADVWKDTQSMPSADYLTKWLYDRAARTREER